MPRAAFVRRDRVGDLNCWVSPPHQAVAQTVKIMTELTVEGAFLD